MPFFFSFSFFDFLIMNVMLAAELIPCCTYKLQSTWSVQYVVLLGQLYEMVTSWPMLKLNLS